MKIASAWSTHADTHMAAEEVCEKLIGKLGNLPHLLLIHSSCDRGSLSKEGSGRISSDTHRPRRSLSDTIHFVNQKLRKTLGTSHIDVLTTSRTVLLDIRRSLAVRRMDLPSRCIGILTLRIVSTLSISCGAPLPPTSRQSRGLTGVGQF